MASQQDFEVLRDRVNAMASKSMFKMDVANTLGVENAIQRAELKTFALNSPKDYQQMRKNVYEHTVKVMVEETNEQIWALLKYGVQPDRTELKLGAGGPKWTPGLPDPEIGKLANGFSESMLIAFDQLLGRILPDEYAKLADDKMMKVSSVREAAPAAIGGAAV